MGKINTDAQARSAAAKQGRQTEYPDAKVGGLSLRVTPAGKKSWSLRYRNADGDQRRLTIGPYPALGIADARQAAWDALGASARGGDPAKEKRAARANAKARRLATVGDLISVYFDDAAKGRHRPNARPKRKSTLDMELYFFDRLIMPRFGGIAISDLSRTDVQRFVNEIGEGAPANARHCRNIIRQAYNYGIREELAERNPAQLVTLPKPASRERVLSNKELKAVWAIASDPPAIEGLHVSAEVGLAICLAMITLQRGGEVIGAQGNEFDKKARIWTIPGDRAKNHKTHVVPLSPSAVDVLSRAFSLGNSSGAWTGYAFPSPRSKGPIARNALTRGVRKICAKLKIKDATPHDFRRTGSTNITGERIGIPRFIVSRILNQMSDTGGAAGVTGVYDRNEYLAEKRRALEAWANLLAEIVSDKQAPSNVVKLGRREG